jgi:hypothetical protein
MIERIKYGPQLMLNNIGGNKDNVVNPRNTFKKEDLIKHTTDFKKRTKSLEELEQYRG